MENKKQIELLQEKKKKLQEAQKNNSFYLDDYQKKIDEVGKLHCNHFSFFYDVKHLGKTYDDFCTATYLFSLSFLSMGSSYSAHSRTISEMAITLGLLTVCLGGYYISESFPYFRLKKKVMKGNVDLYDFGVEQYDAKERQYGYSSAIAKMYKEAATIDRDVSEVNQQLESFTKKKTL